MSNPLRDRRRAERFAQLVEEASGGRRQHLRSPYDEELRDLVALPRDLQAAGDEPEVDPEFRTGLRAMLVATAEREGIGATAGDGDSASPPAAAPRPALAQAAAARLRAALAQGPRARTAIIAGVAVGAVAFTGMSTASENAMPGDPLYGVKRSTERAQLALTSSDVGRGQLYLEFAQTRLAEARTLTGDLDRVLTDMDRETSHGVKLLTTAAATRQDRAALDVIDSFVDDQRRALEGLAAQVPERDLSRVGGSLELLESVGERSEELRAGLAADCPAASSIDALGPVPTDCVSVRLPDDAPGAPQARPAPEPAPAPADTEDGSAPDREETPVPAGGHPYDTSSPEVSPEASPEASPSAAPADGDGRGPAPSATPSDDSVRPLDRLLGNLFGR